MGKHTHKYFIRNNYRRVYITVNKAYFSSNVTFLINIDIQINNENKKLIYKYHNYYLIYRPVINSCHSLNRNNHRVSIAKLFSIICSGYDK